MAAEKKLVAVVGGTGQFGSSVALSLQGNPKFNVRVTSRDPTSAKAKNISNAGIAVVKANSWAFDELRAAFRGCWAVFLNTDSDDPDFKLEIKSEFEMGKLIIDAAIKEGVKHFVFAGLPASRHVTNGKVRILSFEEKNRISDYARSQPFESAVDVNCGWALEIFFLKTYCDAFGGFALKPDKDGRLTIKVPPMGNDPEFVPWFSINYDYGDVVHGVLLDPAKWNGQIIWVVSDPMSYTEVANTYNRVFKSNKARYVIHQEGSLSAGNAGKAKEVNGLFGYCQYVEGNYCNGRPTDLSAARELKALGARARGKSGEEIELTTVEAFMKSKL